MAKYTGPVCRQCRREGVKLFLKGERCYSDKCGFSRRGYAPGQHGQGQGRKKVSEYGLQLREKQKARRIYGVLERQFRSYFEKAERQKGITGENLLVLLERRLDNVVYRMGFASSRTQARQLVMHGHFEVGSHRVDIPSYLVRAGEVVRVCEKSKESPLLQGMAQELARKTIPIWFDLSVKDLSGTLTRYPSRAEMDVSIQEHLIVELYSR
jgi:small subunit ribosomal protein S4